MPACSAVLYSVRIMRDLFGFKHDFNSDQGAITMPDRLQQLPIHDNGSAFAIPIAFSTVAQSLSNLVRSSTGRPAALLTILGSAFPADTVGLALRWRLHLRPSAPSQRGHEHDAARPRGGDAWPSSRIALHKQTPNGPNAPAPGCRYLYGLCGSFDAKLPQWFYDVLRCRLCRINLWSCGRRPHHDEGCRQYDARAFHCGHIG